MATRKKRAGQKRASSKKKVPAKTHHYKKSPCSSENDTLCPDKSQRLVLCAPETLLASLKTAHAKLSREFGLPLTRGFVATFLLARAVREFVKGSK